MNRNIRRKLFLIFLLIITALVSSSCSFDSLEKLWLKSDGWSRGLLLGATSLASPADIEINESGDIYSVLFPRSTVDDSLYQPVLVIIPNNADSKTGIPLDLLIQQPRQSNIVLNENSIDLFWV